METPVLSFVIPVMNEEVTLPELLSRIDEAVSLLDKSFEVIFVDDGSDDDSWSVIRSLVQQRPGVVRGIRFRRNFGKAAALAEGFRAARGSIVFTLDADLQDDPQEIGRFLEKLEEGYDIVAGWKKVRHDPWHKVLPSRVFNKMLSAVSKTPLHDHNCGFKCYRADVVKELALYGEMHRMIPALGTIRGFRSAEIVVLHHPRRFGKSKYGIRRFARGFMDMLTVGFLHDFRERPLHLMGGMAVSLACVGGLVLGIGVVGGPLGIPLVIIGASMAGSAAPVFGIGLLAELLVHSTGGMRQNVPVVEELPVQSEVVPRASSVRGLAVPLSRVG
jgi:dolichol-phosphate mannosyltransferase